MKIYVVGVGVGNELLLTQQAKVVIESADVVVATVRFAQQFNAVAKKYSEIPTFVEGLSCECVAILVSGDVNFYSMSTLLSNKYPDVTMINGISSLQYLSAKLRMPYEDIVTVSTHGRGTTVIPYVCYNRRVFVLTDGQQDIIGMLNESGLGHVHVTVGERLSYQDERIVQGCVKDIHEKFDGLSVMLIENNEFVYQHEQISDTEFIRGELPMTKEFIRKICLSELNIAPTDVVYDIGAGTGSVAIEAARKANCGVVYAVEHRDTSILERNRQKFGAFNVKVVNGKAPQCLNELPKPDKVFIGGSGGHLKEILGVLDKTKVVMTCVTLNTLNEALSLRDWKVSCVNVSNVERIGGYDMLKAQNPIYILSCE